MEQESDGGTDADEGEEDQEDEEREEAGGRKLSAKPKPRSADDGKSSISVKEKLRRIIEGGKKKKSSKPKDETKIADPLRSIKKKKFKPPTITTPGNVIRDLSKPNLNLVKDKFLLGKFVLSTFVFVFLLVGKKGSSHFISFSQAPSIKAREV